MKTILGLTQWESRVYDIFSMVISCKMQSEHENDLVRDRVHSELNRMHGERAVYSNYVKGYVSGLLAMHRAALRSKVEFCYVKNGILFSTHKVSVHRSTEEFYSAERGCELGKLPCAHFWRGSDKPYTPIQTIRSIGV